MSDVGARLRDERKRLSLDQGALATAGGVNRNSQADYEAGKRPWTIAYMLAVEAAGVDPVYVITGRRSCDRLSAEDVALLDGIARVDSVERKAIVTLVDALGGADRPATVHAPTSGYGAPPAKLPSEPALARALEGVLAVYPDLAGAALARALARHLPSALDAAAGHMPDRAALEPAPADSHPRDRRAPATRQHT